MELFIVIMLILGTPFLIGLGLGRLTKGRSINRATDQLDAMWHSGYDAGVKAERLQQARQRAATTPPRDTTSPPGPLITEKVDRLPAATVADTPLQPPTEPQVQHETLPPLPPENPTPLRQGADSAQRVDPLPVQERAILETPAQKQRRTDRNINITLYSATLLIVTASALFISAAVPAGIIIGGLLTVTLAFYVSGLSLYTWAPRLKPAAVAFVGTAVALVPINGLTWWMQSNTAGTLIWLLTSMLGLVMLVGATIRLRNTLGIYLTMPLMVSTVVSAGANLQRGYFWALIFAILFAMLTSWVIRLICARSQSLTDSETFSARYLKACEQTNLILVPLVVVVSWFLTATLTPTDFFILYLTATVYFGQAVWSGNQRFRGLHLTGTYVTGLLSIITAIPTFELSSGTSMILVGSYAALAAITVYWLWYQTRIPDSPVAHWGIGALVGLSGAYLIGLFTGALYQFAEIPEPPSSWNPTWIAFAAVTLSIVAHNLRKTHRLAGRAILLGAVPIIVVPAYFLYHWTSFTSFATTLLLIIVLAIQYRVPTSRQQTTPAVEKYWALNAVAFFGILLISQIARLVNPAYQITVILLSVLGVVWATLILHKRSRHQPQPPVPAILWMVVTVCIILANVTFGLDSSFTNFASIVMVSNFGIMLLGTLVFAELGLRNHRSDTVSTVVLISTSIVAQLLALALWTSFATQWATIAALLVLAGTWFRISVLVNINTQPLLRLCFMAAGQLSIMTAGTLVVSELGGNGSLQRLITALLATAGAFVAARSGRSQFTLRQLAAHRWFVIAIVAGLMIAELIFGQDRAVVIVLALAIAALAILMGRTYGGGWVVTPALWFAAWNVSDYPTEFNGWITGPWYSAATLVWATFLAACVLAAVWVIRRDTMFSPALNLHTRIQTASSMVFLVVLGFALSFGLQPTLQALVLGALFVALAGLVTFLAGKFWGRQETLAVVLLGIVVLTSFAHSIVVELADISEWFITATVLWALCFAILASVFAMIDRLIEHRGSLESPASGKNTAPRPRITINADRLLLHVGTGVVAVASSVSIIALSTHPLPLSSLPARQALSSGLVVILSFWWLALQMTQQRTFLVNYRFSRRIIWAAQTVAYLMTLGVIALLWWVLMPHDDIEETRYWLIVALALGLGLWALRFLPAKTAEHLIWRNMMLIAAAIVFTANSLTLVTGASTGMQLSGLLGFAVLLALGLFYNYRVLSIWGAIGITAAVLWYLRDLTYIWVGLLGVALLAGAIWQLRRTTRDQDSRGNGAHGQEPGPYPPQAASSKPPPPPPPEQEM